MTIEKNRARAFLAALETLQVNTAQVIERLKLDLAEGLEDGEFEKRSQALGDEADAISAWDDALDDAVSERNRYVEEAEASGYTAAVSWKERPEG